MVSVQGCSLLTRCRRASCAPEKFRAQTETSIKPHLPGGYQTQALTRVSAREIGELHLTACRGRRPPSTPGQALSRHGEVGDAIWCPSMVVKKSTCPLVPQGVGTSNSRPHTLRYSPRGKPSAPGPPVASATPATKTPTSRRQRHPRSERGRRSPGFPFSGTTSSDPRRQLSRPLICPKLQYSSYSQNCFWCV